MSTPENDPDLSGLGRALFETGGSKPSSGPWIPPTAEELHQILPQYEIVKMLGRGGMGAVYMGRQTSLERPVAIKILSAQLEESDRGFTERFKNEAKAMAKLNQPGIVSVYDFGTTADGLLYIVMEYVDGTDVAKMIAKSGRLHTEHAMAITAHVCDALAYAHERGIIHRDIKPANIMVGYDGAVKVADFGLAKVNAGGQTLGLTQSGMAMGTMHYMAPEALMLGTSVDHRADIYAVGVMLYQMLTSKLPQGMFKLPSLLVPGLDPRYDAIVRKALMEDRESRYQGIRELRSELDSILTQPVMKVETPVPAASQPAAVLPSGARPQRPGGRQPSHAAASMQTMPQQQRRQGSLAWLWILLLLLVLGGGAVWHFLPRSPAPVTSTSTGITPPEPAAIPPVVAPSSAVASAPATTATLIETFGGHRYQFIPGSFTWEQAKAKAEALGGHLMTITSTSENDWMLGRFKDRLPTANTHLWLGGIETTPNAGWKWVTGEPFMFKDWSPGEPNGSRSGKGTPGYPYMLNLNYGPKRIGWNDSSMDAIETQANVGFIVEWDAQTAPALATDKAVMPQPTVTSATTSSNTTADDNAGWISLFNGKDLSGWELHPSNFPADVFGGLIRIRGSSTIPVSGNMYYRGSGSTLPQWTDFELICTVMTENKGNSGIFLHASPGVSEPNRANGVEVQIWNTITNASTGPTGSLQRITSSGNQLFKDGEWFQVKVRVEGKRVQTWLKKPDETVWKQGVDWTQPAAWTPPSDRPGIKLGSGTISLQNNPPIDGVVWVKDIQFRMLNAATSNVSVTPPLDEKLILGSWTRTNMDTPGAAFEMEILPGGQATWIGDGARVKGTWRLNANTLNLRWKSGFDFIMNPPSVSSPTLMTGKAAWPDGKNTDIRYERNLTVPRPATGASATLWIDTKGRTLQAKFVRLEASNVFLNIAGRVTSVAMLSLSAESQQVARQLAAAAPPAVLATAPPSAAARPLLSSTQVALDLSVEDNAADQITINLGRADRTLLRTKPGKNIVIECRSIRDGEHSLYFWAEGCAGQWIRLEVKDGKPSLKSNQVTLYRLRYVVVKSVFNTRGSRELTGPDVKELRQAYTHWTGPRFTSGTDWQFWQSGADGDRSAMFGDTLWLNPHRYNNGFGFLKSNEAYDAMTTAPDNGYKGEDIKAVKGLTLYFRQDGNGGDNQGYGKLVIEDISDTPPKGIEVIQSNP